MPLDTTQYECMNMLKKFNELKVVEHIYLATITILEEWMWHYRLGHLNFKDPKDLQKNRMVTGLTSIDIPVEICEECVQAKQHKGKFSKDANRRTKNHLKMVYSDVCGPMQADYIGGNKYFIVESYGHT